MRRCRWCLVRYDRDQGFCCVECGNFLSWWCRQWSSGAFQLSLYCCYDRLKFDESTCRLSILAAVQPSSTSPAQALKAVSDYYDCWPAVPHQDESGYCE